MGKALHNSLAAISVFLVTFLVISTGCGHKQSDTSEIPPAEQKLPEDFIAFYQRFHADSAYQIAHVAFPMSGTVKDSEGNDSAITWTAENWKLHHQPSMGQGWHVDFTMPLKDIITEYIYSDDGFYMERRFSKSGNDWMLIYYSGLQQNVRK